MFMSCAAMARAMQAGLDFAEVSTKTSELAAAANAVIGERLALMSKAVRNPLAADHAMSFGRGAAAREGVVTR